MVVNPMLVWARDRVTPGEEPIFNTPLISAGVMDADVIGDSSDVLTLAAAIATGIASGQGHLLANGVALAEGVILAEGHLLANSLPLTESISFGESW